MITSKTTPKDKTKINFGTQRSSATIILENFKQQAFLNANRKSSIGRVNKRFTNFLNSLNDIVEQYQTEYHNGFSNIVFSELINKYKEKLQSYYDRKKENFSSYEDQIKELNMMLDGNDANDANNTINLMIENLLIEKNKIDYDLRLEYENDIQNMLSDESQNDLLKKSDYLQKLGFDFKGKIQELVDNNEAK